MAYDAATISGSHQLYINTTRREAWRIAWRGANPRDGLISLNRRFGLGAIERLGSLSLQFPNGSLIELIGADDEAAIAKALGGAYHRVWIDEAQKAPHLEKAIEDVLAPAMMDFGGQIVLTGTPSRFCHGYFYDITGPDSDKDGWSKHTLTVLENPWFGATKEERYERTVGAYCKQFGYTEADPVVRRSWFAEWVKEDALFVYEVHRVKDEELFYAEPRWQSVEIPAPRGGVHQLVFPDIAACVGDLPTNDGDVLDWHFGVGVDIGYDPDPLAIVVWAWSPLSPTLYEVFSFKQNKLIPDQQALLIRKVCDELEPTYLVGDAGGGGKAVLAGWSEGWTDRYPIPIVPAEKHQKATFQEILNNDIRTGKLRLRRGSPLYDEMSNLSWVVAPNGKRLENVARGEASAKRYPNDCCDAALYAHREARHHRYKAVAPAPKYGTDQYWEKEAERLEREVLEDLEGDDAWF